MSQCKRCSPVVLLFALFASYLPVTAATFTVAKDGSGMYKTIQEAVDKAGPGDIVQVLDAAVYPEQVTIDSTKNGLTLTSKNPTSPNKPKIIWQDKVNVGPKTAVEALVDAMINFDRNGALRVLGGRGVIIDGIAIDGGGAYPFGYNQIWAGGGQLWPLQHGNAALTLWIAGDIIVKNCDIGNAYFGISFKDRNEGGIFANANPADIQPWKVVPLSGFGRTGNHLVEHNRVHNNSIGFFFESTWDLGTTIRYNLIYENFHQTNAISSQVKKLTNEGSNHVPGAFMFKDHLLSPVAIYNNTFWHNYCIFIGNWRAGVQHLIFNNIFAKPNKYWSNDVDFQNPFHEMTPKFENRMHNCVFASQNQASSAYYVSIMNGLQVQAAGPIPQGTPVSSPFPASADIRWLETKFLSEDPASANFLVPDWNDTLVQKYIKDKGWEASGVLDPDGSRADLGAIPSGGGRPVDIVTIKPTTPVYIQGTTANLKFDVTQRVGSMKNPVIKYFRYIRNVAFQANAFGGNANAIEAADIITIPVPATPVTVGPNSFTVTIPAAGAAMDYAFFELIIEGTGSDGKPFTTAVGFLPYRKLDYKFVVEIWNFSKTKQLTEVTVGDTVWLVIKAYKMDGQPFTNKVDSVVVSLQYYKLWIPGNPPTPLEKIPEGITLKSEKAVFFTKVPPGGYEYVSVGGIYKEGQNFKAFLGQSEAIKIHPGPPESVVFQNPPSNTFGANPPKIDPGTTFSGLLFVFDKYGNKIDKPAQVALKSLSPSVGDIVVGAVPGPQTITTDAQGSGIFGITVTNGKQDQVFTIIGTLTGKNTDSADVIVGKPREKLWIFYGDTLGYDINARLEGQVGDRLKIVVIAALAPKLDAIFDVTTPIALEGTGGLMFYNSPTAPTPASRFMLTSGRVDIWVSSAVEIFNGWVSARPDSLNTIQPSDKRENIYFTKPLFKIDSAFYYADNGFGRVNRAEVFYKDSMPVIPDSVALHWPQLGAANRKVARGAEVVLSADKRHYTVTLAAPFAPDITAGDAAANLGTSYQKATAAATDIDSVGFPIKDRVGPLVMTASVVEKLTPGGTDVLYITFSEAVPAASIKDAAFILIQNGAPSPLTVVSAVPNPAAPSGLGFIVTTAAAGPFPKPGDSLRINPAGSVMDALSNKAHDQNRPVEIKVKSVPATIDSAYYQDRDANGKIESVVFKFKKKVSIPDCNLGLDLGVIGNKVDAVPASRISYINGDSSRLLVDVGGLLPLLNEILTSVGMKAIVTYKSFPGETVPTYDVIDSAAPVAKAASFNPGPPVNDLERAKDTVVVEFSEAIAPVSSTTPFRLYCVVLNRPYHFVTIPAFSTIANAEGRFVVQPPIIGVDFPVNNDSLWLDPAARIADTKGAAQTNPLNRRVLLKVKPIPWEPKIAITSNPFSPEVWFNDTASGLTGTGMAIIVKPNSQVLAFVTMAVSCKIYDALGNVIVERAAFEKMNGKNTYYFIWDGRNRSGRNVGTGTYLAMISVTPDNGLAPPPTRKIKIGVKR